MAQGDQQLVLAAEADQNQQACTHCSGGHNSAHTHVCNDCIPAAGQKLTSQWKSLPVWARHMQWCECLICQAGWQLVTVAEAD